MWSLKLGKISKVEMQKEGIRLHSVGVQASVCVCVCVGVGACVNVINPKPHPKSNADADAVASFRQARVGNPKAAFSLLDGHNVQTTPQVHHTTSLCKDFMPHLGAHRAHLRARACR